jgi:hypothetical protein
VPGQQPFPYTPPVPAQQVAYYNFGERGFSKTRLFKIDAETFRMVGRVEILQIRSLTNYRGRTVDLL